MTMDAGVLEYQSALVRREKERRYLLVEGSKRAYTTLGFGLHIRARKGPALTEAREKFYRAIRSVACCADLTAHKEVQSLEATKTSPLTMFSI